MIEIDEERYEELYDKARNRCLDKIDWDVCDWLTDAEAEEFVELSKAIYGEDE